MRRSQNVLTILLAAAFVLVAWGGLAWFSYNLHVQNGGYLYDFFPRYYGTREWFFDGFNPYHVWVELQIQQRMNFEFWQPHRHNFLYPATISFILLPFWLLPWELSISLWMGGTLLAVLVMPLMFFLRLGWRVPPLLLIAVTFFSVFIFRHSMHVYLFGQFFAFIILCLLIAWWAMENHRPGIAALALIGATVRPDGAILAGAVLF
ncbi:MAG: hypothetical protein ACLFTK_16945, partial [Anaerolineales bacterium]